MAPQKLVICKNAEKIEESDWESLAPIIDSPSDFCVLVFVAKKVDQRKKYFKTLNQCGQCVDLKTPYDNKIPQWIKYIATSEEVQIEREAILLLHQLVGSSLSEIRNEILKLKSYLNSGSPIQASDVLKVVSPSRVHSVFDLTKALGKKNISLALRYLKNLLESGENQIGIFSLILRHFRILSLVHQGRAQGLSGPALSAQIGVPSFFLKEYLQQAQLWSPQQIKQALQLLHHTDRALKSSQAPPQIWLENFIIKSC